MFLNVPLIALLVDNTAGIVTKRSGFRRRLQEIYLLPVVIEDNGYPPKSSTGTLTIRVCGCESDGSLLTCGAEAIFLPVGLSTGALIAILLCIIILLGETFLRDTLTRRQLQLVGQTHLFIRHSMILFSADPGDSWCTHQVHFFFRHANLNWLSKTFWDHWTQQTKCKCINGSF